jgi:chromosome segregation ATPase
VTESRFHDLEQSKQVLVQLGEEYAALQARLLPLKDERSGIKAMIHQLDDSCAQLVANIEGLERDGDTKLAERVKRISEELFKLDSSHKDINSLFAKLSHELKNRSPSSLEQDLTSAKAS